MNPKAKLALRAAVVGALSVAEMGPPPGADGAQLAKDLLAVYQGWVESITARRTAAVWQVLPLLLRRPVITSALLQDATGLSQPAADNVIAGLREAGVLTKAVGAQRYVVWVAGDVTQAVDDFAGRAQRQR
ncbi:hypothetical protein [Sporichthya sp.]|uniref:hypothetical protein n=1 Tax=Sporichthya sp. TaxID=65475 RepID=UPI0017C7C490|nr:hypothetical protein [Sporichthya sp.]MBA3742785.1 hypothetical protein [Sporichthya sp.]